MGLDMYLSAEKYVNGFNHATTKEKTDYETILSALNLQGFRCDGAPSLTVRVKVAYWRKANAIHRWFVVNCQDGKDECQETDVEREQLELLAALCQQVLVDRSKAGELLPPQAGFFFGSTAIDAYYFADLEDTVKQLRAVLDDPCFADFTFNYRSSW